jgi:hypothetical protein
MIRTSKSQAVAVLFALCATVGTARAQDEPGPAAPSSRPGAMDVEKTESIGLVDEQQAASCLRDRRGSRTVDQYREEALRFAMVSPKKIAAAIQSARNRGLYPTIHLLGLYRNDGLSEESRFKDMIYKVKYDKGEWPYRNQTLTDATGHQLYAGVALRFELGTLAGGEAALKALRASKIRSTVVERVNALFYERDRLQIRLCTRKLPYERRLLLESRIDELTSLLDGLAGGGRKAR